MSQSYVVIDGREELVEVTVLGDGKRQVTVDGKVYEVDTGGERAGVSAGARGASLLVDGRQFEVFAHRVKTSAGTRSYALTVNGVDHRASVTDPLSHLAQESDAGAGSARVEAYMPGRVVALLVAEGDTVELGQGVLVLEAMKMENEIAAEAAGVVQHFFVELGQAVEGGDPLFEVVPPESST